MLPVFGEIKLCAISLGIHNRLLRVHVPWAYIALTLMISRDGKRRRRPTCVHTA